MHLMFTVPGKPKAKQRARTTRGGTFTPKPTVLYENHVKACFTQKYPDWKPTDLDITLAVIAYWPIPKSGRTKAWREEAETETIRRNITPDWDNVGKIVSDALNNIAWIDDKQITDCTIRKRYSPRPRLEVSILELRPQP